MDVEYHNRKPQNDIPTEVIIHYIVKDYQRMFLTYDEIMRGGTLMQLYSRLASRVRKSFGVRCGT